MGQRHQVFVIARILYRGASKPKYRCIAAHHDQWCYGRTPLRAARRFITLVKQKDNAEIVRAEFRLCQDRVEDPSSPCPFTAFLLKTSWNVELTDTDNRRIAYAGDPLDVRIGCWDEGNNDGITIIDITTPESPSYCYATDSTPLSAEDYVRSYHAVPFAYEMEDTSTREMEEDVLQTISALADIPLIDISVLAETWPSEFKIPLPRPTAESTAEKDSNSKASRSLGRLPSLVDLSITPAIAHAMEAGDTTNITEMLLMLGKTSLGLSVLQKQSPFQDAAVPLLKEALKRTKSYSMNLTDYDLSPTQLLSLLAECEGVFSLNLSFNRHITADTVRSILMAVPHLRRLVLMGCQSVIDTEIAKLIDTQPQLFYNLDALIMPSFLRFSDLSRSAFSVLALDSDHWQSRHYRDFKGIESVSIPIFTPTAIVQSISSLLLVGISEPNLSRVFLSSMTILLEAAFTYVKSPTQTWGERSVVAVSSRRTLSRTTPGWIFLFIGPVSDYKGTLTLAGRWGFVRFLASKQDTVNSQQYEKLNQDSFKSKESNDTPDSSATPAPEPRIIYEVYDLRGFLRISAEEGRPAASEELVAQVEVALDALSKSTPPKCQLITLDEVENLFDSI